MIAPISDAARLREALAHVCGVAGVPAAPDDVRDAVVALVTSDELPEDGAAAAGGVEALRAACRRLGLATSLVRAAAGEVLDATGPGRAALTRAVSGELVVVSERDGGRLRVEDGAEARWVAAGELASLLGRGDGASDWIVVEAPLATPSAPGAMEHGEPTPHARLRRWMVLEREDLLTVLAYAAFIGVLGLTVPVAVQSLVGTVAFGTLLQPLVVLSLLLFGALALSAVLRGLHFWVVEVIQRRVFVRLVSDLAHRLPRVSRAALDGRDGGELANRFFDVVTIQKSAASLLLDGLELALTVAVGLLVLAFYHPLLLAFDVVLVVVLLGVVWLGRRGGATAIDESHEKYAIGAWLEELARQDATFKLGGGLDYAETRSDTLLRRWLAARARHFRIVARQVSVVLGTQALGSAGVLGIGGWLVIERQLTLGQLVAAELIVTAVVAAAAKTGKYLESYYDLLAAVDKVGHLLDLEVEPDGATTPSLDGARGGASLELHDVCAGGAPGQARLEAVSFHLPAGARAVLTGGDGSAQTLLTELVAGLRRPERGCVRIGGLDLRDVALAPLRAQVAIVRGTTIVPDTILENVRMGRRGIEAAAVRRAIADVGLGEAIDALPDGLATRLTSIGAPLSRGARARLAIARAIVAQPALLVLDDALEGLDAAERRRLLDALFEPSRPWTLIVAGDDADAARRAGHVLRLHGPRLEHERTEEPARHEPAAASRSVLP